MYIKIEKLIIKYGSLCTIIILLLTMTDYDTLKLYCADNSKPLKMSVFCFMNIDCKTLYIF